jgi:hypothetical protein
MKRFQKKNNKKNIIDALEQFYMINPPGELDQYCENNYNIKKYGIDKK